MMRTIGGVDNMTLDAADRPGIMDRYACKETAVEKEVETEGETTHGMNIHIGAALTGVMGHLDKIMCPKRLE